METNQTALDQADGGGAGDFATAVERLTAAAEALEDAMSRVIRQIESQQQELGAKVERIVAAIDENADSMRQQLQSRVTQLEGENADLKASSTRSAAQATRRTLPPLVSNLLAKGGVESASGPIDPAVLERTLGALSVEQRIAVKAEMARAGLLE